MDLHRSLAGEGAATDAELVGFMVRRMNCTPTEAIRELRHNPHIAPILTAEHYRDAYITHKRWEDSLSTDKPDPKPTGRFADMVARNEFRLLKETAAARDAELEREGRV